jgi:hypothetical protein
VSSLRCPGCGECGHLHDRRQRGFEPRGTFPDSEDAVYRCINCGCGLIVKERRLLPKPKVEQIDLDLWGRMEYQWGRENPLPATEVPATPTVEELVRELRGSTHDLDHLVHLVAEAAEVPVSSVWELLAPPTAT